ncbi:MAG TPA: methyltransferase domain-containing protein [Spirochaetia bacterium]|nr:methyltransferase domain-containing protein [Spirochaetia bacterium]
MTCPQCVGIEDMFDDEHAEDELRRYRRKGARRTTRILIRELASYGVKGKTVLDIGGGVGALHLALLKAGADHAIDVDASAGFLRAAQKEASRRRFASRVTYVHGDFVDLAHDTPHADIVALDKVVCCYPDAQALLDSSADHTGQALGLVYPRDGWISKLVNWAFNLRWVRMTDGFKTYVHSRQRVEEALASRGLQLTRRILVGFWQVVVFSRPR